MDSKGKIVSTTDLISASAAHKKARPLHIDSDFEMIGKLFDLEKEILLL
jgi:hypothetical protein